jgi:hypothetical protein
MQFSAEQLYILDAQGQLASAPDLVYNDAPWMPDQQARFVHSKISNEVTDADGSDPLHDGICARESVARQRHDNPIVVLQRLTCLPPSQCVVVTHDRWQQG